MEGLGDCNNRRDECGLRMRVGLPITAVLLGKTVLELTVPLRECGALPQSVTEAKAFLPLHTAELDDMQVMRAPAARNAHEPAPVRKCCVEFAGGRVAIDEQVLEQLVGYRHRLDPRQDVDDWLSRHSGNGRAAKVLDRQELRWKEREKTLSFRDEG